MPSINLLPENFTIEAFKKREKLAVYILAVFFLFSSAAICAWAEGSKQTAEKNSTQLTDQVTQVEKDIKYSVDGSDILSSQYSKTDVEKLLKEHVYLSKGMALAKSMIINGAYLTDAGIASGDDGSFSISLDLVAKDYDTMLSQFSVFQDSFWVVSFKPADIKLVKDKGVSDKVTIKVRKDMFLFHEQYWDFGISTLASSANRYLSFENYTVVLKKDKDKTTGKETQSVVVNFTGSTFDTSKLDEYKKNLEDKSDIVKTVKIDKLSSPNNKPGVTSFSGNMILKY